MIARFLRKHYSHLISDYYGHGDVDGLRNGSTELTVEGGPQSDRSEGGTQAAAPEATYISEVQVNTLDLSAKFNLPGTRNCISRLASNA
jgi:hypothetical protein